ncbi:MAG: acetyltransferase [Paenibacillus dendritiformis]|uniref:acetyltransferase n=1 Tax=Paenibacillus dendritiformis TaxID=130049 RepID=UPI00143DC9EC|nr:acetyltransferase [Paenibacillus dendritiformis]MDU5143234.1 acetyltransferase [Paenibacillus dendritiformis]NKI21969.1 acetyltransferase [Paenibacillus dendritiformis]NRF98472.1 acetyltransferase [Paenibacillus dendritiformis]GIO72601.1 hexapeptide transferase [Paenibacillus dendritiformis]
MSDSQRTIVIGAGGHAKVIIDILRADPAVDLVGCTSADGSGCVAGVPVLGDDSILPELYAQGVHQAFVAIGDNRIRWKMARTAANIGYTLINAISRHAYISPSASLGSGIAIMPGAVVNAEARIRDFAIINTGASVDHESVIGEACHIAPGSHLSGNVRVGEGSFLGTGTQVIDGTAVGAWSVLGAGAVVVRDIPDQCLAVGVPARVIKHFDC